MLTIETVIAIAAFAWHYSLFCGYISDDHATVAQRKDIIPDEEKQDRGEGFWLKRFNDGIVMFYLTRFFWALGFRNIPFFWHLFSYLLHLSNVYLLYLVLFPIIGDTALYVCAFWSVNPMINQNVVWISGRPYSIALFLSLIALINWNIPYVFISFYLLALITNISIFFVPVLSLFLHPESIYPKIYIGSMLLLGAPWVLWKFNKRFTRGLVIDRDNFAWKTRKINTLVKVMSYYIWTIFTPVRMGWYHQAGFRYNEKWEKFNYLSLLSYAIIACLFFSGLGGWWYILGILPNSNVYATNSFLQDRYTYFASIGIAILLAPILQEYPILFYVAMTFYVTRSYMYSRHMKNDEKMYRENWRNHPKSDYAINNLCYFLIQQLRYDEARVIVERGLHINDRNKMLWYNLGITYAAQGNFANDEGKFKFIKALDCWKKCLEIEPRWAKPANDLKKLIKLLVDNKVLTLNPKEGEGFSVSVPPIIGMKEILDGKVNST